jgi:hypothetical protein
MTFGGIQCKIPCQQLQLTAATAEAAGTTCPLQLPQQYKNKASPPLSSSKSTPIKAVLKSYFQNVDNFALFG